MEENYITMYETELDGEKRLVGMFPSDGSISIDESNIIVINGTEFFLYASTTIEYEKPSKLSVLIQEKIDKMIQKKSEQLKNEKELELLIQKVILMIKGKFKKDRIVVPKEIRYKHNLGIFSFYLAVIDDHLWIADKNWIFQNWLAKKRLIQNYMNWVGYIPPFLQDIVEYLTK